MKLRRIFIWRIAGIVLTAGRLFAAEGAPAGVVAATPAVNVPDAAHQNDPLPDGVLAWDGLVKETNIAANVTAAHFIFSFTNVSPASVTILQVQAGCHCTTTELPALPWIIPAGSNAQFGATVNLSERSGPSFKSITVRTDQGFKQLTLKISILPLALPALSGAERAKGVAMAKADRQAVLHGDCAVCHVQPGGGKYGKPLYDAVCGVCHEARDRASVVPDLHQIKTTTNPDFWQTWAAHGKAGSLMPAFSQADGGPLSDMQIASLAQYLAATIPSQIPANQ